MSLPSHITNLPPLLTAHLRHVETTLIAEDLDADDVEAVLEDLAVQLAEMLHASPHADPDEAARDVLARLDAPDAFAHTDTPPTPPRPASSSHNATTPPAPAPASRRPRRVLGPLSLVASFGGVFLGILVGAIATHAGYNGDHIGWLAFCGAQLIALCAGVFAWRDVFARVGIAGALGFPALAMALAALSN